MKQLITISFVLVLLVGCQKMPVDWSPYFESQHKTPFGTKILQEELEELFPYTDVEIIKNQTPDFLQEWYDEKSTYFYINTFFWPTEDDFKKILTFKENSNSVFIATESDSSRVYSYWGIERQDSLLDQYHLRLKHLSGGDRTYYLDNKTTSGQPENNISYFTKVPSYAKVLGTIQIGSVEYPNFISIEYGSTQGAVYVHANPELYTNYHLLHKEDALYSFATFSYLENMDYVLWDGFGTERRYNTPPSDGDSTGLLRYVLSSKSLSMAFALLLLTFAAFFIFNYKRITRAMPLHLPKKNNSLHFTKLVAHLFMKEENHITLAQYRTHYFLDLLKEKYFIDIKEVDDTFLKKLAAKTGLSENELKPLILQLKKAKQSNYMNETDYIRFCRIVEPYITQLL